MTIIDMQTIRYINLLSKVSQVKTSKCFVYNNTIVFAVPKQFVSRAIGSHGKNIQMMQNTLGKRIRIIPQPENVEDAAQFVRDIVEPIEFKSLEIKEGSFVLTAGGQSKAMLIGRNKKRLEELSQILHDNFGKQVRIV